MTPEQTLDWLAQQHFDQCREERPIQDWIRKMKSQLPEQSKLCKYGQEPKSCTSSPMDCQCALDATFEQPAVTESHKRKPHGYAGITIWGGDAAVTKVFTETEMKFAREPRSLIESVFGQCLDELAAHGIVGDTHD